MEHYLCLTDLLDQDLSAYEYFQTLPPAVQTALRREDGGIGTLDELQARVAHLQDSHLIGSNPLFLPAYLRAAKWRTPAHGLMHPGGPSEKSWPQQAYFSRLSE